MLLRKYLHKKGYRYRLHVNYLPGKPDIVFSKRRKVIFVHGCFWHRHNCEKGRLVPSNNASYWKIKLQNNVTRFHNQKQLLESDGWSVYVVWECQLRPSAAPDALSKVDCFLDN
jgi:DNA mismatch endonuclease (patch repair protein)